ncbi:MAG: HPr family phosphocarrier protein [Deltaproteobacteria bacterium]|nr:MAG: HPr family phosphocarrier protein [Deltaproteobacteria bacterium]
MGKNNSVIELSKNVTITNPLGLHARSAAKIAKLVKKAKSKVWIIKDQDKADASRIIDILSLLCMKDSKLTLLIDDQSDINILNDLVQLFENRFGE